MSSNPKGYQEGDDTPQGQLKNDLLNLVAQWEELGIDPDDFVRCGKCHKYIRELVEGTSPPLTEEDMCKCIDRKELKYEH